MFTTCSVAFMLVSPVVKRLGAATAWGNAARSVARTVSIRDAGNAGLHETFDVEAAPLLQGEESCGVSIVEPHPVAGQAEIRNEADAAETGADDRHRTIGRSLHRGISFVAGVYANRRGWRRPRS